MLLSSFVYQPSGALIACCQASREGRDKDFNP
jgi:hypothetical protein